MKNHLALSSLALALAVPAAAGGVFYNSNQSAEYIRSFDRNSAVDNADIVYYNMASTPYLKDGWTFNFSDQMIFQRATVETVGNPVVGDKLYRSNNPALIVPNFYAAYKKGDWSVFAGLETLGATAIREWKGGLPTLDLLGKQLAGYGQDSTSQVIGADAYASAYAAALHAGDSVAQAQAAASAAALQAGLGTTYFPSSSYLKGSSYYLALRLGAARILNPQWSVAVAGRIVTAQQGIVGSVDSSDTYDLNNHDLRTTQRTVIDVVQKANGFSGEICVNWRPVPEMVLNLTYEMATPLDFKTTVHDGKSGGGLFVDGSKAHLDLPQVVRFGLGYQLSPGLRLSFGANAYLEKSANFSLLDNPRFQVDSTQAYRNTYEEQAALEYKVNPRWLVSFGVNFNQIGQDQSSTIDISIPGAHANYMSEGAGFQYTFGTDTKFNFGLAHTAFMNQYENADAGDRQLAASFAAQGVTISPTKRYNKEYYILAFGVDFHF